MKLLIILLSLMGFPAENDIHVSHNEPSETLVTATVTLIDGTSHQVSVENNDFARFKENLTAKFGEYSIGQCAFEFSDGSCSSPAATCEESWANFTDCACDSGHGNMCDTPPMPDNPYRD